MYGCGKCPRLISIAGDFTKYDEHAVQQINRDIELVRYRRYEDVRKIGHFGTGDLGIRIVSEADVEKAKPLLMQSYEAS